MSLTKGTLVHRYQSGQLTPFSDQVTCEQALRIDLIFHKKTLNHWATIMRTPGHDEDLCLGLLFSEGLIEASGDILVMQYANNDKNHIRIYLGQRVKLPEQDQRSFMLANSSCGLCGTSNPSVLDPTQDHLPKPFAITPNTLLAMYHGFSDLSSTFTSTGGIHICAAFDQEGQWQWVAEDVGRHNALDKLIGQFLNYNRSLPIDCGILLSGRVSFELVQKAIRLGAPLLVAHGAPSSAAIDTCEQFGITLVGFLKPDRFNVYTYPDRIVRISSTASRQHG